jgi:uncharacterized membrane protein
MATTRPPQASSPTRPGRSSEGFRIAPSTRQTRPILGVVAVLLILVGGAAGAYLYLQAGSRTEVLAVARMVPAGHRISQQDLRGVRVSVDTGLSLIPDRQIGQVVGKVAATTLLPGTLLSPQALATTITPSTGEAIVGLDLAGAQLPVPSDQLSPGAQVELVRTPPRGGSAPVPGPDQQDSAAVLVERATVYAVEPAQSGDSVHVAVVVDGTLAPTVLRLATAGQVSVAVVPAGGG